ncbi:MAG: hypothetical protein ACE5JX_10875 [Acidobacteriota bacterium]
MKTRIFSCLVAWLLLCLGFPVARAARPERWTLSSQEEFLKGDFDGVSVSSAGELTLAPALDLVFDTEEAFIHAAVVDKTGNLFLGTGSSGKVFRITPEGEGGLWSRLEQGSVYALAVDSMNRLFAGGAPDGKVYLLNEKGNPQAFFNPNEKYIWDLAVDREDNLYVATGPKGIIYRVDAQGKGSTFLDSKEIHIVSLDWDLEGNLLAGTAPGGLLYRISKAGKPFVLYDSSMGEVKAMTSDRYGNIFALGLAFRNPEKARNQSTPPPRKSAAAKKSGDSSVKVEGTGKGEKLEVYRIDKEGRVETVYTSNTESAYDLLVRNDGTLLLATGNKGRILSVSPRKFLTLLVQSPDDQVTRLLEQGGGIYAAASNLGKLYRLQPRPETNGVYQSQALDAHMVSSWGRIGWRVNDPLDPLPKVFTRSGNTKKPDENWSDWSGPYEDSRGSAIQSPSARYLQCKIEFAPESRTKTVVSRSNAVDLVSISYLQRNMAPVITGLTVHGPGIALAKLPAANPAASGAVGGPDNVHIRSLPRSMRSLGATLITPPPRQIYVKGARSVSWSATDPNGDDLVFSVYYRGQDEKDWKLLRKDGGATYYSMDGASIPDGAYTFKVVASDRFNNPPSKSLEAELVSKPFVISNTSPRIEISQPQVQENSVTVQVTARTSASSVYQTDYAVDAGEWQILYPRDGIADSEVEEFDLTATKLARGEHLITVRVVDSVGNIGTAKVTFSIQ